MKQQKFFVIVITICAFLLSLAGCASSSAFDGSSAKNADSYHLDVKILSEKSRHGELGKYIDRMSHTISLQNKKIVYFNSHIWGL